VLKMKRRGLLLNDVMELMASWSFFLNEYVELPFECLFARKGVCLYPV